MNNKLIKKILLPITFLILLNSCNGFFKYSPARDNPIKGMDRAKKNIDEGRGISIGGAIKNRGKTNYEVSTSNPLWRASLEILDFMPLNTVDYSGGMIISDWYSDGSQSDESIKVTVRFLSNEIRSDSVRVMIHKKNCSTNQNCKTVLLSKSKIIDELQSSIVRKAATLELDQKKKKRE